MLLKIGIQTNLRRKQDQKIHPQKTITILHNSR